MKNIVIALLSATVLFATDASGRTIHTNSDPAAALFLTIVGTVVLTVVATFIVRTLRK
jgi:hypothetical protein